MELEEDESKSMMIVQEMQMMIHMEHENIVACHGVFFDHKFQIVMEYMDAGSLLDLMRVSKDNKIPIDHELRAILQQVMSLAPTDTVGGGGCPLFARAHHSTSKIGCASPHTCVNPKF